MDERYWQGWREAIESAETRLSALQQTLDPHTSAQDVLLDAQNELKELKKTCL